MDNRKKKKKAKTKTESQEQVLAREKRIVPRYFLRIHLENARNEYFRVREDPHALASWIEDTMRPLLKKVPFHIRPDGSNIAYVSKAALEQAKKLGISNETIMSGKYVSESLTKYDKGHKLLMHEHVVPVKEIIEAIQNPKRFENVDEIIDMMEIALITKDEDHSLSANNFASSRPGGWRKCYRDSGIEIVQIPLAAAAI